MQERSHTSFFYFLSWGRGGITLSGKFGAHVCMCHLHNVCVRACVRACVCVGEAGGGGLRNLVMVNISVFAQFVLFSLYKVDNSQHRYRKWRLLHMWYRKKACMSVM